jgi:hypothetical protein
MAQAFAAMRFTTTFSLQAGEAASLSRRSETSFVDANLL